MQFKPRLTRVDSTWTRVGEGVDTLIRERLPCRVDGNEHQQSQRTYRMDHGQQTGWFSSEVGMWGCFALWGTSNLWWKASHNCLGAGTRTQWSRLIMSCPTLYRQWALWIPLSCRLCGFWCSIYLDWAMQLSLLQTTVPRRRLGVTPQEGAVYKWSWTGHIGVPTSWCVISSQSCQREHYPSRASLTLLSLWTRRGDPYAQSCLNHQIHITV